MCHQDNLRFYDDIAYDKQYKGLILDGFEGMHLPNVVHAPDMTSPQAASQHESFCC